MSEKRFRWLQLDIRDLSDADLALLKAHARREGQTLSEYVGAILHTKLHEMEARR